jgi:hypothetical protein
MNREKRPENANPQKIAKSTARKVLSFLNAAQSAEEIASAVEFKGERDVGTKVAESLLDRRARLGGFHNLSEVAATPQVGEMRFSQIVTALESRKESAVTYIIEGQVKSVEKIDLAGKKLAVHALVNGIDLASAEVDSQGKYKLTFQYREQPATTELRLLPAGIPIRSAQNLALSKTVSPARYTEEKLAYHAAIDMMIPPDYIKIWGKVTKNYKMHGVVYATTFMGGFPISVEPLPAAKIEFYEVDTPIIWLIGTEPALTEAYLGYAYTAPDGSYDFTFNFSYNTSLWTWYWLFTDKVPDIRARISQFVDGLWKQVYEGPVDWNIVQDFHRDYFIPKEDVIPVPPGGVKPAEGFRFISLGLIPIDTTRIQLGYATSQAGDPITGISHQPFCGTLRIFGLFAEAPPIATYKVQIAAADEDSVIGAWQDVADALYNHKWNDVAHKWDFMVLGPDPVTGRYQNIDTQPESDWHEHALKVTWNSANVANGYYAIRVIGYDATNTEVGAFQMPIIRVDNSLPEIKLEVIGTSAGWVTDCGVVQLGLNRKIQFKVTCYDAEGHVKRYWLSGTRGKEATSAGSTIQEVRPDPTAGWVGVKNKLVEFTAAALTADLIGCPAVAYNFELHVRGLATDGYSAEPISQWDKRESNLVVSEP